MLFDGEEATDDSRPFEATGLRGSTAYAKRHDGELRSLVLLDFVGAKDLRIFREALSDGPLWAQAARAARRVGAAGRVPRRHPPARSPTTTCRSCARGVPAIDLIQWPYGCWHLPCDDLDAGRGAVARPDGGDGVRARSYTQTDVTSAPEKLLLAAPRGYCAGVDRAVQTVEHALELHGAPVYVRKEIVHNKHVVEELAARGAIFVDELDDAIPEGAITVFSAHGVRPAVHADAAARKLRTIDATCPLVTKVHREAIKFAEDGYTIVLVGHAGHEEVEGTMGEAPDAWSSSSPRPTSTRSRSPIPSGSPTSPRPRCPSTRPARSSPACARSSPRSPGRARTTSATRRPTASSPSARWPSSATSCSSSARRNSSNSNRLVDVARDHGAASHLIDNASEVREEWLEGVRIVGISSGASAPDELVAAARRLLPRARDGGRRRPSRSCARTSASCCRR